MFPESSFLGIPSSPREVKRFLSPSPFPAFKLHNTEFLLSLHCSKPIMAPHEQDRFYPSNSSEDDKHTSMPPPEYAEEAAQFEQQPIPQIT
jgi:hypothetical protein